MINHLSIGVRDLSRAQQFYDSVLTPLGYSRISRDATSLGYGRDSISFWILAVERPVPPEEGSGLHICFDAPTRASVDSSHAAALSSGGRDHGKPGLRADYGPDYYAAFFFDPDGYRIEACCDKAV